MLQRFLDELLERERRRVEPDAGQPVAFAAWTGFTFVGFFTPIRALAVDARALALSPWELFWILFYGFATYGNAGYLREQVCKYCLLYTSPSPRDS